MCFCLNYNIGSLPIRNLLLSWCLVKFNRVQFFQLLLKLWPINGFQLDQFLHKSSIFAVVIGFTRLPCNGGVAAFSYIAPHNSPSFQKGNIPLVFNLNYFFFFLVNSTSSCVSRIILLAVCTCNFFQAIFLCMVRVIFAAFGTCLSSSTGFPVVSKFLTLEAPQGSWDVLLNSLKTIADLSPLLEFGAY